MSTARMEEYKRMNLWVEEYHHQFLIDNARTHEERACVYALADLPLCNGGFMINMDFISTMGAVDGLKSLYARNLLWENSGGFLHVNDGLSYTELREIYKDKFGAKSKASPKSKEDMSDCYIYLLDNGFHRKVGISNNVKKRIKQLQTASSLPIKCVQKSLLTRSVAASIERKLHAKFSASQTSGEWFSSDAETISAAMDKMVDAL